MHCSLFHSYYLIHEAFKMSFDPFLFKVMNRLQLEILCSNVFIDAPVMSIHSITYIAMVVSLSSPQIMTLFQCITGCKQQS